MYTNKKGVSNTTMGVLIVVALVVVITATLLILNGTANVQKAAPVGQPVEKSSGLIQLEVVGVKQSHVGSTGLITLNVQ